MTKEGNSVPEFIAKVEEALSAAGARQIEGEVLSWAIMVTGILDHGEGTEEVDATVLGFGAGGYDTSELRLGGWIFDAVPNQDVPALVHLAYSGNGTIKRRWRPFGAWQLELTTASNTYRTVQRDAPMDPWDRWESKLRR